MICFKKNIWLLGLLLIFTLSSGSVKAADDNDLFDELEEDATGTTDIENGKATPGSWVMDVVENFEGSLEFKYSHFLKTSENLAGIESEDDVGEALFRFSSRIGRDNLKLYTSGWLEAGTQDDTYRGAIHSFQDKEYYRRHLEINELYALYSRGQIDFTAGKKEFTTGICTLFSPSDRYCPMDLNDPLYSKQLGIWQVKADYYQDTTRFEFAVLPINMRNKSPAPNSRWWGENKNEQEYTILNVPNSETVIRDDLDISWENVGYFAKAKTTKNGWDVFLGMSSGPNPYTVLKSEGTLLFEKIIRVYTIFSGFSTTFRDFEIHGEALYNLSEDNKDDDYISSAIGATYTVNDYAVFLGMEQVVLTVEYVGEIIIDRQSAEDYIVSSKENRAGTNDLLTRIKLKFNEDLRFENLFHYQISDNAWMDRFEMSYRLMAGWTYTCAIEFFEGDKETQTNQYSFDSVNYAQWDRNDRVIIGLKYEF